MQEQAFDTDFIFNAVAVQKQDVPEAKHYFAILNRSLKNLLNHYRRCWVKANRRFLRPTPC